MDLDCFPSYKRGKNVHEIDTELLLVTSSNQSSLVAICPAVKASFDLVDPSGGDGLLVDRERYQGPGMIVVNGIDFGLHGGLPVRVGVGFLECKEVSLVSRERVMLLNVNVSSEILEVLWEATYPF